MNIYLRVINISLAILFGCTSVFGQCKIDTASLTEIYSIMNEVNISSNKQFNLQMAIGAPPDVDNWNSEQKDGCINKTQLLSLVEHYIFLCEKAKVSGIDQTLLKNLKIILDEDNYAIDMYYGKKDNGTKYYQFYIRNQRMWIFMGPEKIVTSNPYRITQNIKTNPENWNDIVGIFENFDTTAKYRCAYEFAINDLPEIPSIDKDVKIKYAKITKENVFYILKLYKQLTKNRQHVVLEEELLHKLNRISIDNMYDVELRYTTDNGKVKEIECYINNQTTAYVIVLFYSRNPDGTTIK